jgi:hypothetical protein
MTARALAAITAALLIGIQSVRLALVESLSRGVPETAERVWPGHPEVRISTGMTAIARAAREGLPVDDQTLDRIYSASAQAPLADQPFLVRGVQAQLSGDLPLAEKAFVEARNRDPRSIPARYFLADRYLARGDVPHGLLEIGALARIAPNGVDSLAPFVAQYARDPRNRPALKRFLYRQEALRERVLLNLAQDASGAPAALALADPAKAGNGAPWVHSMLGALVKAGQYSAARKVWARASRVSAEGLAGIYDPQFRIAGPPPPFNWRLESSSNGIAERTPGGGLHVIHYGQSDVALAEQLLLLAPGRYRMTAEVAGGGAHIEQLRWSITCAGSDRAIVTASIAASIGFSVPSECRAQWLRLNGVAPELPQQADATVRAVRIVAEAPNG